MGAGVKVTGDLQDFKELPLACRLWSWRLSVVPPRARSQELKAITGILDMLQSRPSGSKQETTSRKGEVCKDAGGL
ncbi:hypothetical protein EYF80_036112 [Liparis tanakae]|uniref:Uncharacterized protein n=1 Tax=Liparis tanakae TaxID=230148 RepID=A0A4Z2GJR1_9TELE|nr:hypothetical protein EYF80_036112 [Liparis tanakae]